MVLDPLSALGLASSAVQIIDFFLFWKERQVLAVAHFASLHEKNIQGFDRRLKLFVRDNLLAGGREDLDSAAHDELHDLLHRYCEAIVDFEQMNERSPIPSPNRSRSTAGLERVGMLGPRSSKIDGRARTSISFFIYTLVNFMIAISVGAALIVPMLIMVLHPSRNTSLITTCVFVFLFASALVTFNALAYWIGAVQERSGNRSDMLKGSMLQIKDIIGATAAYAAVLVVFVGLSKTT